MTVGCCAGISGSSGFDIEPHHIRAAYQIVRDKFETVIFPRKRIPQRQGGAITAVLSRCVELSGGMLQRGTSSIWNLGTSAVEVVVIGNSRKLKLVRVSGAAAFATEENTTEFFGCH